MHPNNGAAVWHEFKTASAGLLQKEAGAAAPPDDAAATHASNTSREDSAQPQKSEVRVSLTLEELETQLASAHAELVELDSRNKFLEEKANAPRGSWRLRKIQNTLGRAPLTPWHTGGGSWMTPRLRLSPAWSATEPGM
jgi:hypothetical protein